MLVFHNGDYYVEKIWGGPEGDRVEFSHPNTGIPVEFLPRITDGLRLAGDDELFAEIRDEVLNDLGMAWDEELISIDFFEVVWEERVRGVVEIGNGRGRVYDQEFDLKL